MTTISDKSTSTLQIASKHSFISPSEKTRPQLAIPGLKAWVFTEDRFPDVYYPMRKILPVAFGKSFIDLVAKKVMNSFFPGAMFFTTTRFVESLNYCRAIFLPCNDEEKTVLLSPETIENGAALQKKKPIPKSGCVTVSSLEEIIHPEKRLPPTKQRYYYVLSRIKKIAKMMRLSNPIKVFINPKIVAGITSTSTFSLMPVGIHIDHELLKEDDAVLDFAIAHELAHLKNNGILDEFLFNNVIWVVNLVCLMYFPLLIFLIETVAIVIEKFFLSRKIEKDADFLAMSTLATNRGAVRFFHEKINENRAIKRIVTKSLKNPNLLKWIQRRKDSVTPEGNFRKDFEHPPLTERLAYARAFVPQKNRRPLLKEV